jgi:uncharacterized protein YkwD
VQQDSLPSSTEERMTPRDKVRVTAALVAAAFLLTASCGGGIAAGRASPGVIESGTFKPTRPPVAKYGPDPSLTCPQRGINGLVENQVGPTGAKPEGRLCAVADTLFGWEGSDNPPDNVLAVISNDFGLPLTVRGVVLTNMETAEESARGTAAGASPMDVAERIAEPIRSFASTAQVPRYGLVVRRIKKGLSRIALVMQDQSLDIQPLPRKLNPGESATLSGTLAGKLTNAKVRYTDAVGKLEKLEVQGGKTFTAQLKCGDRPGRIIVEVAAEQEGADMLLANFPVGCGTDLPIAAAVSKAGAKQAGTTDPAAGEKQLADLLNQERTTAGLKPLEVDADLSKVARSLAEDRAKGQGTTPEEVHRRLRELDISAPTLLVSEGQAMSAEDAFTRFSSSPQDRANAMSAEMTHVGIGIAPGAAVNNRPTVIVTELFLKELPPPNADEVKKNLYQAISRRRSDARAGSVTKDPELDQIAQTYATEMARQKGKVPKEKVAQIEAPLYKSFATVNEIGGVKADALEFAEEPGIVEDAKLVGVGVGIGVSPQFGKNSTYVVILLGKRQAAKAPAAGKQPVKKK